MELDKETLEELVNNSTSLRNICMKLGYSTSKSNYKKLKDLISKYNIDTNALELKKKRCRDKYERIIKKCPVCENEFEAKKGHPKEKVTCSHSCSNSYFRSNENNPNWKGIGTIRHRDVCFRFHDHKCVVCSEDKILDVHHLDHNRNNNIPENLIPLCPTHHRYWHSEYRNEVEDKILDYVEKIKEKYNRE